MSLHPDRLKQPVPQVGSPPPSIADYRKSSKYSVSGSSVTPTDVGHGDNFSDITGDTSSASSHALTTSPSRRGSASGSPSVVASM